MARRTKMYRGKKSRKSSKLRKSSRKSSKLRKRKTRKRMIQSGGDPPRWKYNYFRVFHPSQGRYNYIPVEIREEDQIWLDNYVDKKKEYRNDDDGGKARALAWIAEPANAVPAPPPAGSMLSHRTSGGITVKTTELDSNNGWPILEYTRASPGEKNGRKSSLYSRIADHRPGPAHGVFDV